jgi:DNA-binding CsgD family transcriptional regulator
MVRHGQEEHTRWANRWPWCIPACTWPSPPRPPSRRRPSRQPAAELVRKCEGARTPGLLQPAAVVPLTRRESEVATLAATAATSKEIALTLHLSARTVDNHLQSAYAKLGVTRRTELATALNIPSRPINSPSRTVIP